jgi:hypothetical protein
MKLNLAVALSVLELLVALPSYGIYLQVLNTYGSHDFWEPIRVSISLLSMLFVLLPIYAVFTSLKNMKSAYLAIILFPLLATIFGVTTIPFINLFYPGHLLSTTTLIVINFSIVIAGIYAWRKHAI